MKQALNSIIKIMFTAAVICLYLCRYTVMYVRETIFINNIKNINAIIGSKYTPLTSDVGSP